MSTRARCHTSCRPTSLNEARKRLCTTSRSEVSGARFSFSERLAGKCSSASRTPIQASGLTSDFSGLVRLQNVPFLEVVEAGEQDAALEPFRHLARVFGEALEGAHLAVVDHHVAAEHARARVASDHAVRDHAAGDGAQLGGLERRADLGLPEYDLLDGRLEHADQGRRDVLGDLVDDPVRAHVDAFGFGERGGRGAGPHAEADDDRRGGAGQHDVVLVDAAYARMDDAHLDLGMLDLEQRVAESLEAALHVGLDHEVEVKHLARGDAREDVVEGERALLRERLGLEAVGAIVGPGARHALVLDHAAELAGHGKVVEADDLDRRGRAAALERVALEVAHRAHAAAGLAGDDRVADVERAAVHEDGGDDAAAGVDARLDDEAAGRGADLKANVDAPALRDDAVLAELL